MKRIVLLIFIALGLLCVIPTMALETGNISVTSNPPGAEIWIDNNLQTAVVTPYTFDNLAVGTHNVRVHLDGYLDVENDFDVTSGQIKPVEFQLEQPSMDVSITSESGDSITGGVKRGEILLIKIWNHPFTYEYPWFHPL